MNKVLSRYTIVTANNDVTLEVEVGLFLSNGWQPIGGVSFDGRQYLQAMVRYGYKENVSDGR